MTSSRRALALAAALTIAAGCGPTTPAAPGPAAGGAATTVDISGFAFSRPAVEVAKGTTVTWTNKDGIGHTVSSGTPPTKDGKFDGPVAGGSSFSFTFNDAGTFTYFCSIHTTMTGTVTVK